MKKLLLATTAIAGFATVATPALADGLSLDLGGFYRAYGVFTDNDETSTAATADEFREFDLRHDAEIYFSAETTLDNGLTVGFHAENELGEDAAVNDQDEVYAYFSGNWGRFNLGLEDGAAYLLQVAAPSADSNVDGLRNYFQVLDTANLTAVLAAGQSTRLDYAQDSMETVHKITYLTPKFSGFQAGVSYAPEVTETGTPNIVVGSSLNAPNNNDDAGDYEHGFEVAARWDGEFEGVGISAGAGYGTASEEFGTPGTTDDWKEWNAGLNLSFAGFDLGAAYTENNNGADSDNDVETWVIGAGWNNGPYTLGVSWFDRNYETGVATDVDVDRLTFGGTYSYGPGMTFRGAVAFGEVDATGTANDRDFTQVTVGTEINF